MVEWWSSGVVEWWSGGVVEWWSGGVVEWWSASEVQCSRGESCPRSEIVIFLLLVLVPIASNANGVEDSRRYDRLASPVSPSLGSLVCRSGSDASTLGIDRQECLSYSLTDPYFGN
jgi:hypothetical protein